jgi:hypothetical protein
MVLNLTFVLEKKDAPKLEFGRKYSLKRWCTVYESYVIHGKEKRTDRTETVRGWW